MSELFYSKKSHRKIVHLPNCKIIQRVSKENKCSFVNLEQAHESGYRLCKCCPPVGRQYIMEKAKILNLCENADFICTLRDNEMHIISRYDCWMIIAGGKKNELLLYHKNTRAKTAKGNQPVAIGGYHLQSCRYNSIINYIEYIRSHDRYRELPRTTKEYSGQDDQQEVPEWMIWKYGEEYFSSGKPAYKRKKGTKAYKKAQKKRKREKRRVNIDRVYAILEGIALTT